MMSKLNSVHTQLILNRVKSDLNEALARYDHEFLGDKTLREIKHTINNQLVMMYHNNVGSSHKFDLPIKFDLMMDKGRFHVDMKPMNLFTALLLTGIVVPHGQLEGKEEYEHPTYGKFRFDAESSNLIVTPHKGIDRITCDITITKEGAEISEQEKEEIVEDAESAFEVVEISIDGFDNVKVAEPRLRLVSFQSCDEELDIILEGEDTTRFLEWMKSCHDENGESVPKKDIIRSGTWKTRGFGEGKLVGIHPISMEGIDMDASSDIGSRTTGRIKIDYQKTDV